MVKAANVKINETAPENVNLYYDPILVKLVKLLSEKLKFSYITLPEYDYGQVLPGGNWSGIVGMLQRSPGENMMGVLVVSEARNEVIDFSHPFLIDRVTFATVKPEFAIDALNLLRPFSFEVWLSIVVSYVLVPLAFFLMSRRKHSLRQVFFSAYKVFVNQPADFNPQSPRECLVIASWILGLSFLSFCYKAILLSFLTFPTLRGARTIPELAAVVYRGEYKCTTFPGAFLTRSLLSFSDEDSRIIGHDLQRNVGSRDIETVLKSPGSKKPVFISLADDFLPFGDRYYVSEDMFFPAMKGVALPKGFCCHEQLNRIIHRFWASGLYLKWRSEVAFEGSVNMRDSDSIKTLTVGEIEGAFFLLSLGLFLAILSFACELAVGNLRALHEWCVLKKGLRELKNPKSVGRKLKCLKP